MCAHSERTAQNLSGAAVWSAFLAFVVNYTKPYVSSLYTTVYRERNQKCVLCATALAHLLASLAVMPLCSLDVFRPL